jgi:hypothetical protein
MDVDGLLIDQMPCFLGVPNAIKKKALFQDLFP